MRVPVVLQVSVQVSVLVSVLVSAACGGNVLVFPGEFSHWLNVRIIMDELLKRNHSVSVVVAEASPSVKYNDPTLRDKYNFIVFKVPYTAEEYMSHQDEMMHFLMYESHAASLLRKAQASLKFMSWLPSMLAQQCEAVVKNDTVMGQLRDGGFHAVLFDPMGACGDLVADLLDVPLVVSMRLSIGGAAERLCAHVPLPPSYVPAPGLPYDDHMTFAQRVVNVLAYAATSVMCDLLWRTTLDGLYSEVTGRPNSVCATLSKADAWLIRMFWDIETPRPLLPNFHYIGGFHCKPAEPLPEELEAWVRSSGDAGLVVVTFGSMVTNLTTERADVIAAALAQIPQKVIWRYSGHTPNTLGSNTRMFHWIPQNDLLGHPQTRAFVSHGGTNGLYEAVFHGVPLVGVPLFGDQSDNLARLTRRRAAIVLDFNTMTSQEMTSALNTIINDPSYRRSMLSLSSLHRDRPVSPLQEAVFWVEFVMRNGRASHLRLGSHDLTWLQYHSLDVAAFLLVVTATAIAATATVLRLGLRLVLNRIRGRKTHQD